MISKSLALCEIVTPRRHADERGFFSETWREEAVREGDLPVHFVQDNHSLSHARGTVRELHFQIGDAAQRKLVRCIALPLGPTGFSPLIARPNIVRGAR